MIGADSVDEESAMGQSIGGVVPLDSMLAGITSDVLLERDPSGDATMRLLTAIDRHAASEAEALGHYEQLAQDSGDPVIALVMRLILDDEERHHGLLKRIATTLRDAFNWTHSPGALPHAYPAVTIADKDLVTVAGELIEEERTGAQALRRLAQRERANDGGLDAVLLEMMAMDSDKHARLLRFVQRRLEARVRAART
jgi:hypothetical protein